MKKVIIAVVSLVAVMHLLIGCKEAKNQADSEYKKVRLVMTANGTDEGIETLTARRFIKNVEEESGGMVQIEYYPNDEMTGGNTNEAVRSVMEGAVDIGGYVTGTLSMIDERLEVGTIPWAFKDYKEARRVIDESGAQYYEKILGEYGLVYIGSTHNAFRQLTNNVREVRKPTDIKGLKIRVLGGEVYRSVFKELGAEAVPLGWSELKVAIKQGVVDGQENGFFLMHSGELEKIQKYMTIWNYVYENYLFVVNKKTYDQLDAKTQKLLKEKMKEACEWSRDYLEAEEQKIRKEFEREGVEIVELKEEELKEFQEQVKELRERLTAKYGEEACKAFGIKGVVK